MRETEVDEEPDYRINLPSGRVVDVTVNKVEPWDKFPSGWHYALHYGTRDGDTILRYLENRGFSTTRRNGSAVSR
jgi:hypothetical protein